MSLVSSFSILLGLLPTQPPSLSSVLTPSLCFVSIHSSHFLYAVYPYTCWSCFFYYHLSTILIHSFASSSYSHITLDTGISILSQMGYSSRCSLIVLFLNLLLFLMPILLLKNSISHGYIQPLYFYFITHVSAVHVNVGR